MQGGLPNTGFGRRWALVPLAWGRQQRRPRGELPQAGAPALLSAPSSGQAGSGRQARTVGWWLLGPAQVPPWMLRPFSHPPWLP